MSPPVISTSHFKGYKTNQRIKDIFLGVECTVLSLSFFFFCCLLCALCMEWSLFLLSNLCIASLLFFPNLIYSTIDLTLNVACLAHLLTLLVIGLVFIAIKPSTSNFPVVAFLISSSTSL